MPLEPRRFQGPLRTLDVEELSAAQRKRRANRYNYDDQSSAADSTRTAVISAARPPSRSSTAGRSSPSRHAAKVPRRLIVKFQRLIDYQRLVGEYREDVRELREEATRQRKRARRSQKRLDRARAESAALDESVGNGSTKGTSDVSAFAQAASNAWKVSRQEDKRLETAEQRLIGLEYKLEVKERKVYDQLESLVPTSQADVETQSSEYDDDDDDDLSSTIADEDIHPLIVEYQKSIATINIIRERLNEFEIGHRRRAREREIMIDEGSQPNVHAREFLNDYFVRRTAMVKQFLAVKDTARQLQEQCEMEDLHVNSKGEQNALEEALRYNVGQGEVSHMYSLHWEKTHRGIRPVELLLIPYLHTEDRIIQWMLDVKRTTFGLSIELLHQQAEQQSEGRAFDLDKDADPEEHELAKLPDVIQPPPDGQDLEVGHSYKNPPVRPSPGMWNGTWMDSSLSEPETVGTKSTQYDSPKWFSSRYLELSHARSWNGESRPDLTNLRTMPGPA